MNVVLHGRLLHRWRLHHVGAEADKRFEGILRDWPAFTRLPERIRRIADQSASLRSRFGKLLELADEIGSAVAPHSGCAKGCSACCNIAVSLSSVEAERIGHAIGVKPAELPVRRRVDLEDVQGRHFGHACPFLKNSECSIYADRPVACRLHFTLDRDGYFCQTSIKPEESVVPNVDLSAYWMAYGLLSASQKGVMGDIREFFPGGADRAQ